MLRSAVDTRPSLSNVNSRPVVFVDSNRKHGSIIADIYK